MAFPRPFFRWRPHPWHGLEVGPAPPGVLERLRHYFLTYKLVDGEADRVQIADAYGRDRAFEVVEAAVADYAEEYGE